MYCSATTVNAGSSTKPIFLKKIRTREGFVHCSKHTVRKMCTNNREQNTLGLGNNNLRSVPDFTIKIFQLSQWIIRVKWSTRAGNMASIGGLIKNPNASSVNILPLRSIGFWVVRLSITIVLSSRSFRNTGM